MHSGHRGNLKRESRVRCESAEPLWLVNFLNLRTQHSELIPMCDGAKNTLYLNINVDKHNVHKAILLT